LIQGPEGPCSLRKTKQRRSTLCGDGNDNDNVNDNGNGKGKGG